MEVQVPSKKLLHVHFDHFLIIQLVFFFIYVCVHVYKYLLLLLEVLELSSAFIKLHGVQILIH